MKHRHPHSLSHLLIGFIYLANPVGATLTGQITLHSEAAGEVADETDETTVSFVSRNGQTLPTVRHRDSGKPGPATLATIVNGDFSNGLTGWTTVVKGGTKPKGRIYVESQQAVLLEGTSFLVSLQQSFRIPQKPDKLNCDLLLRPGFDLTSKFIPDAFEVQILNAQNQSVVPTWDPRVTACFNLQETGKSYKGQGTQWNGKSLSIDLSKVKPGTLVTVYLDLIGADKDTKSGLRVDNVAATTCPGNLPPLLVKAPRDLRVLGSASAYSCWDLSFTGPETDQTITRITVDSGGLKNFKSKKPVLGKTGTVTLSFTPSASQLTQRSKPYLIKVTAWDSCSPPLSTTVTLRIEVSQWLTLLGIRKANLQLGGGDTLLLDPLFWMPVYHVIHGPIWIPALPVKNLPIYTQILWWNPQHSASDPLRLSNGVVHVAGGKGPSTTYGPKTKLQLTGRVQPWKGGTYLFHSLTVLR